MKFARLFAVSGLAIAMLAHQQAWASTASCYTVTEPVTTCNNTEGNSRILRANTIPPSIVPFPVKITSATIADNASPLTTGQSGIWQLWLDPGSAFANANPGYPNQQNGVPGLTLLAMMELQPGLPMHAQRDVSDAGNYNFDSNDSLVIDMPCNHPPGQPNFAAQMFWSICWRPLS